MLQIVSAPNQVLSQIAKKVSKVDKNITKLVVDMEKALDSQKDPEGVGLAAPQVGKSLQLFIMKPSPKSPCSAIINPVVIATKSGKKKKGDTTKLEGCLSLPTVWGDVERDESITISYQNEKGENHTKTFVGFPSIIVQHEIDHLNGILFPKRVLEQDGILYKSHKDKHGKEVFNPIEL